MTRPRGPALVWCGVSMVLLAVLGVRADAQTQQPSLKQLQFDIIGVRLVVDPPALTVPKNIPTIINTTLVTPPNAGASVNEALASLTSGAVIEAELRGPSIPPTRIVVPAGSPIPIPAFALPGDYFLDGIRLVKDGQPVLDATTQDGRPATQIPIRVISDVFVTSVTSRPLTLDEIREKGIVIDESSFQAVNFQAAFNIDGQPFTIELPAVLPTAQLLSTTADRTALIQQVSAINQTLAATETKLPPEFDRPGINFSIAALPFFFVPDDESEIPALDVPPVNGLVVIAGNVAFLNQFFKVSVLVANVTPEDSNLQLRDVKGTIVLPTGLDRIAGTPDAPGDDPLRLARIESVGAVGTVPILQTGPDGVLGTADDQSVIAPQKQGEGELLLEGRQEGGHTFEVNIEAFLDGLPSGPVKLMGLAAGAVFVRNPTFSVTLAHPRTIRSGENYDLYATVTNTSRGVANLVSVNLDPLSISGAQLLSASSVSFETIRAGESAMAKFTLRAQLTGDVTFSSFTGEAASGGGIRLFTGIGERNVPLSPNAIVLPTTTSALPPGLVAAAQRVLGQALSIATAPADGLPPDVLFVKRQTVIDRGLDLGLAGERVQFGEPLARVVEDLLLDWLGNSAFDAGFDQLLRTTEAGREFLQAVAAVFGDGALSGGVLNFQQSLAELGASRPAPHISVIAGGPAGASSPLLTVARADGAFAAIGDPGTTTMAGAGALAPASNGSTSPLTVLSQIVLERHVFELTAQAAGAYDLGIVVPGDSAGVLRQLRYSGVALGTGGIARVTVDLPAAGAPVIQVDANGDGIAETSVPPVVVLVTEPPPQVLAVRQLESSFRSAPGDVRDPATYGLILGVMLNKPVSTEPAETKTNYTLDNNEVSGARLQSSGRLVYLYLQKPVGGLTARSLRIAGLTDLRAQALSPVTVPIQMAFSDGGHVFGQVREAGGAPVPDAVLQLTIVHGVDKSFTLSGIRVDQNGSFDFDFVPRIGQYFALTAQHPSTRDLASLSARIRGAGEQLLLNPTFTGRGTVRGRLLATDGVTPVPGVPVALIPGAVLGLRGFTVITDDSGEFQFGDVPVGIFTLTSADTTGAFAQAPGLLPSAGQTVVQDLVLVAQPESAGYLGGRVFMADGLTPGAGFTVYVGRYDRLHGSISAYDSITADASGSFSFARALPPSTYDVVAVDPATKQVGTTSASILAGLTTSVSIVLESTGVVEGVVFNAQGQPVPGAVIAGGLALGSSDANGFFRITGVPAGPRTIEAGDPVTKRRGSAAVTVVPGQTVSVAITLEARATITGRVLDANGNPMPRVSVRLPQQGGFTFVFTNNQGVYTFPDMPLGSYLIQAPGPSVDSLIEFMQNNGMDPRSAFTTGDAPPELDPTPVSSSDANAVLAAYQEAVQRFLTVDESLFGLPMASVGGFGFNQVQLFQDSTTVVADVKFLSQGLVGGHTEDSNARPTAAVVRILGLAVSLAGFPRVAELGRMTSDAATGAFQFGGIPRFDLATFQTAGVRGGDFTLDAAQPFSPAILTFRSQLNTANPDLTDIVLQFPSATDTNGTVSGQVLLPDGTTAAPGGTRVEISFGDLTVLTGADGRFQSLLPIPAGTYTVTATAPNGLRGQATASVPAGGNADIQVRLLGLGSASIVVRRTNGVPVVNALVTLERATFPHDRADGRTDAGGTVQFVNLTEGPVGIVAEEDGTGLMGRASGVIVRDVSVVIPLTITASGRVTGRFLSADGSQSVPFAQVTVSSGGIQAFTSTDGEGRFETFAIPVGRFSVEANDPLTGRLGRASGELLFEGQTVDVTLLQLPRGTVSGIVRNADNATAVPAARVQLTSDSIIRTDLQATARTDGSFRFEGIPEGTFSVVATDPVSGFAGRGTGRITSEGELVDLQITLDPFATLRVFVQSFDGQPAGNATVTLSGPASRTAAVDVNGTFTFEHLPLGGYTVIARSLANSGDGGLATATLAAANETVDSTVRMRGTGSVTVRVVQADGTTPVASAQVTVNARGAFGTDPGGPVSGIFNGFTDGAGNVTFVNVPIGDFFARGEASALAGVATGTLPAPGDTAAVTVQLGASGAISGRVLLPDGLTPAAQSIVTLRFQSQSQLQSGVLQVTTPIGGTFEFSGIPLGTFSVSAFEVVSSGVRTVTGSLESNGQLVPVGDLVLDNAGPRVVSIAPADGAANVAPDAAIAITFSEPIDPASLRIGGADSNVALLRAGALVAVGAPVFSDANRTVTIRPADPLLSGGQYLLSLKGAPDGLKDASAFSMTDAIVSTFTVRDTVPPAVLSVSPSNDALGVLPEAVVRVAFSEPVATATLVVRTAAGAVVPGTQAFSNANTTLIFSPQDFLQPNTFYTVTLSNVADTSGNPLAPLATRFFTVDTLAPLITALQIVGTPREGSSISVQPVIAATDTVRVEFRTSDGLALLSTVAPFGVTLTLGAQTSTTISAVAVDAVGNRSTSFDQVVAVQSNAPPVVTLTNTSGSAIVAQGQTLTFQVRITDDGDLSQVLFSAVGAATVSTAQAIDAGRSDVTTTFNLTVPSNAPSNGTITVQAAAVDAGGLQSVPASTILTIRDAIGPVVTILGPVNNAVVLPGQAIDVVVDTSDDVALASVALVCNPSASGCETRTMATGTTTTRQTFSIVVPQGLQAPQTVTLSIVATDASGNTAAGGRVLLIADALKPAITALQPVSGSTQVVAGTTVSIRATVSDNVGVTALLFATEGAVVSSGTAPVAPPVVSGDAVFSFAVPGTVANGSGITVNVRARDAAGNESDLASVALTVGDTSAPVVEFLAPAADGQVNPGQTLTVRVRATDDTAVAGITLTASGVLTASEARDVTPASTPAEITFNLSVPVGTPAGQITLTAAATDSAGTASVAVQRSVTVNDVVAPQVRIISPAASAVVDPRQPIQVTVEATDAVGVTRIAFASSGAIAVTESRTIDPAAASKTETFTITFIDLPVTAAALTLTASARDAAGNDGAASAVNVTVRDVVGPVVSTITPLNGASDVSESAQVRVQFSEPVNAADITSTNVRLSAGGTPLPATVTLSESGDIVTIAPSVSLALSTLHTVTIGSVRDTTDNVMAATFTATFTTRSPDADSPRVQAVDPADGATGVALTKPMTVTFTEAVAQASVTASSFRVTANGSPVTGSFTFVNGDATVRFTAADPWPAGATVTTALSAEITDTAGRALVDAQGAALTGPLTFTFTAGTFGITSPKAGSAAVENSPLTLEARGSGSLGLASVTFTVNGQALAPVAGPNFITTFNVPSASTTPTLSIEAAGRDGSGAVVASDTLVVDVVTGLTAIPRLTGIPVGGASTVRLRLSSPASEDLPLTLRAANPAIVSFPQTPSVLRAGETELLLQLGGVAAGATTVFADSARGTAAVIVSVSDVIVGQSVSIAGSTTGVSVLAVPSIAHLFVPVASQAQVGVRLLSAPATAPVAVDVVSSDPAVVSVTADPIAAGSQVAMLSLSTGQAGVATLTFTIGGTRTAVTIVVGAAPAGVAGPVTAAIAAASIQTPRSIGYLFTVPATAQTFGIRLLAAPRAVSTAVQVSSSNPAVVAVGEEVQVAAGSVIANLALTAGEAGTAVLTLVLDGVTTSLTVFVGPPPGAVASPVTAPIAGGSVLGVRSIGQVFAAPQTASTLGIRLLATASGSAIPVEITSSNPAVVAVSGSVQIAAGSLLANVPLVAGVAGTATLTLRYGASIETLTVTVGPAPAGVASPVVAPPGGFTIMSNPSLGLVGATAVGEHTFGVRLLSAPAASDVPVTITSSNPTVAAVSGSVVIGAGQQVAPITIVSSAEGTATLTITAAGQTRLLTILIGAAAASQLPVVVAPAAGANVFPLQPTGAVLIMPVSGQSTIGVPLLSSPAASTTPVSVTSSNAAVAQPLIVGDIPAGSTLATITIQSGVDGIALLTVTVNGQARTLPVLVGTASAGQIPVVIAPIASIEIKQE